MSRVLVVDDETAIRRLIGAILARDGHEMVEAKDAAAALAPGNLRIDAAIVDLGLPDRDGLELIATMRCGPRCGATDARRPATIASIGGRSRWTGRIIA